jgi:hypothetical protein
MIATISPADMERSMPLRTWSRFEPVPYDLWMFLIFTIPKIDFKRENFYGTSETLEEHLFSKRRILSIYNIFQKELFFSKPSIRQLSLILKI